MKSKLALLILSLSFVFLGCKKDKTPEDLLASTKKQIVGTWRVQSSTETYYDSTGKVVSSHDAGLSTELQFQIDASNVNSSESPDNPFPYKLTKVDNKVTIQVDQQSYQVAINNDTMVWSIEQQYQQQDYAKSVYNITFKKQ